MKAKYLFMASALTFAVAAPAFGQVSEAGEGSADENITLADTLNGNTLSSEDNDGNGDNRDNTADYNGDNRDNSADQDNDYNGDNRDNDYSSTVDEDNDDNGNNRDNTFDRNGDNRNNDYSSTVDEDNDGNGDNRDNDYSSTMDQDNDSNGDNRDNDYSTFDVDAVVGVQILSAVATGDGLDASVRPDAQNGGYRSGDNTIGGAAFANFAGILNTTANTGSSSNSQAATNIAASGTVTFGSE